MGSLTPHLELKLPEHLAAGGRHPERLEPVTKGSPWRPCGAPKTMPRNNIGRNQTPTRVKELNKLRRKSCSSLGQTCILDLMLHCSKLARCTPGRDCAVAKGPQPKPAAPASQVLLVVLRLWKTPSKSPGNSLRFGFERWPGVLERVDSCRKIDEKEAMTSGHDWLNPRIGSCLRV